MINLLKNKLIVATIALGLILIAIFQQGLYPKLNNPFFKSEAVNNVVAQEPKIVSTIPSPLNEATILPTQTITINFNLPLENLPEFKYKLEPEIEHKIEISDDRKSIKITPVKNFILGQGYSLNILPDTKFEGKKTLDGGDEIFHFTTISYSGV